MAFLFRVHSKRAVQIHSKRAVHFAFHGYVLEEILVFYGYVLEEILVFYGYVLEKCRLFAPSNQSLTRIAVV